MNLYDGTDLLETTSTEVKNRILKPGKMLRAIDTGALYYGDKDGKPTAFVGTSTTSSGGVVFDTKTQTAIRKAAAQNALVDPYYEARPPSLIPINTLTMRGYATDGTYIYGFGANSKANTLNRMRSTDSLPTELYAFPAGYVFFSVYVELGVIFAVVRDTSSYYSIYRSTDGGNTFVESVKLGYGSDGIQYPSVFPFYRGLCSGTLSDGRSALLCSTYSYDLVTASPLPKDRRYVLISYDKGGSWNLLWELNVGVKNTRHIHSVQIDAVGRVIVMLGDDDSECATIVANDITKWQFPNNVTPAQLSTYAGFSVATGAQNHRCVDAVIIPASENSQRLITYSDASSESHGGIWARDYPSLKNPTRIAHPNIGQTHDGWLLARNSDGVIYACDACLTGTNIYFNISGSSDGLHWFNAGRYYIQANASISGFFFTPEGMLAISSTGGAGPAGASVTHIYRLGNKMLDDDIETILAPVVYVRPGGNDSLTGSTPTSALATVRQALAGFKASSKCRIVVQGNTGPMSSAFISQARWGSSAPSGTNNTADTNIYWHVSGDGADKTTLEITGAGGISGSNSTGWTIRIDALKLYRQGQDLLIADNTPQTGQTMWIATDAIIGDADSPAAYNTYMQTGKFFGRRSRLVSAPSSPTLYNFYVRDTGAGQLESCVVSGGRSTHRHSSTMTLANVTFDLSSGYVIDFNATNAPVLKNVNFGEGVIYQSVLNSPSLELSGTMKNCYIPFLNGASNIPAQLLPVGSAAMIGAGYKPLSGSPLIGAGSSLGVKHDLYGVPFATVPSIGAVEGSF